MTILAQDENGNPIMAVLVPDKGATFLVTTAAAAAVSQNITTSGLYRISTPVDISICIGGVATSSDMDLISAHGPESFYMNNGDTLSVFDAGAGGAIVKITPV